MTRRRKVKRVWCYRYATLGSASPRRDLLATFTFDGDTVTADYKNEHFKTDIEAHGILVASGNYQPRDGRAFFDNLALAYSQSTLIRVESADARAPKRKRR